MEWIAWVSAMSRWTMRRLCVGLVNEEKKFEMPSERVVVVSVRPYVLG
jgi:hypothetical protein